MNSIVAMLVAGAGIYLSIKFLKGIVKTIATIVILAACYYYLSKYGYIGVLMNYMRDIMTIAGH